MGSAPTAHAVLGVAVTGDGFAASRGLASGLLCAGLLLSGVEARGADPASIYVPFVKATIDSSTLPEGAGLFTRWESLVGVRNVTASPATVTIVALHGNGAQLGAPSECYYNQISLAPQTGNNIIPCVRKYPEPGIAMMVLQAPPGVLIRAEVQKARFSCGCADLGCTSLPQGQAFLPVFRGLFPAGSTAVSGAVELGNFDLPTACATANQQYRRRVNLTLYNGGDARALFRISETPNHSAATPLYSTEIGVEPKDTVQINSLPVPTEHSSDLTAPNSGNRIWVNVTADQPFLSYVSTVFDDPEVGALPFQVYPGSLAD